MVRASPQRAAAQRAAIRITQQSPAGKKPRAGKKSGVRKSAKKSAKKSVRKTPAKKSGVKSAKKSVKKSAKKSVKKSAKKTPAKKSVTKSAKKSAKKSGGKKGCTGKTSFTMTVGSRTQVINGTAKHTKGRLECNDLKRSNGRVVSIKVSKSASKRTMPAEMLHSAEVFKKISEMWKSKVGKTWQAKHGAIYSDFVKQHYHAVSAKV